MPASPHIEVTDLVIRYGNVAAEGILALRQLLLGGCHFGGRAGFLDRLQHADDFRALGVRTISGVLVQLDKSLEECGEVCGASWFYRMRTITMPLLRPGLIAAWLLIFVASVRELGASILLMGPNSKVLTPAIVEAFFSSSSELTAAMALIQTVVVGAVMLVFLTVSRRAARHGA